ncbi:MAG: serine hydrolase, partial [Enterobacter hormaechei]
MYEAKINVNDPVANYIPGFSDATTDKIKGKSPADYRYPAPYGGLPADPQYHNKRVAGELYSQDKQTTLEMIKRTPLVYSPGSKHVYSDVDYMMLGFIIEYRISPDTYVENKFTRLSAWHTVFNPLLKGFKQQQIAATELNGNTRDGVISIPHIRTTTLWCQVHDEKAWYSMGGVSGHAGLFSNTQDIAVLMQTLLNGGCYGNVTVFDKHTVDE